MKIEYIIAILVVHYIFDWLLQTNEMADNKSKDNELLLLHVGVYSLGLALIAILIPTFIGYVAFVGFNAIAHFITDYISSRCSKAVWEAGDKRTAFNVIGLDQLVHYITLFGSFYYLSSK